MMAQYTMGSTGNVYNGLTHRDLQYWLINHSVSSNKIDKKTTTFVFGLYKQKNTRTSDKKNTLGHIYRESKTVNQFPDTLCTQNLLNKGEARFSPPYFLRDFSLNLKSTVQMGWLPSDNQGSTCLHHLLTPSSGVTGPYHLVQFYRGVEGWTLYPTSHLPNPQTVCSF